LSLPHGPTLAKLLRLVGTSRRDVRIDPPVKRTSQNTSGNSPIVGSLLSQSNAGNGRRRAASLPPAEFRTRPLQIGASGRDVAPRRPHWPVKRT